MADFPLWKGGNVFENVGTNESTTELTWLTASSTANTKGAWTELIAASSFDYHGVWFNVGHVFNVSSFLLIDIAIGGAGSEVVIMPNLSTCRRAITNDGSASAVFLPLFIPKGSRISARCQSTVASGQVQVGLMGIGGTPQQMVAYQRMADYGTVLADSRGTQIFNGAINVKSVFQELEAVTAHPIKSLMVNLVGDTSLHSEPNLVDICVGAEGSEVVLVPNIFLFAETTIDYVMDTFHGPFPVDIPAGTRLSARCQSSVVAYTPFLIVHGFD